MSPSLLALPLELGQVSDPSARRALEQISLNWTRVGAAINNAAVVPVVSSLPNFPVDGQQVDFQDAAMANVGVRWRLVYRASATGSFKWEFVGGAPMATPAPIGDLITTSATPVALTGGPTIAVPLSGSFDIAFNVQAIAQQAASGYATAEVYADAAGTGAAGTFVFQSAIGQATFLTRQRRSNLTLGATLGVRVSSANGGSNRFVGAVMFLQPVRVI